MLGSMVVGYSIVRFGSCSFSHYSQLLFTRCFSKNDISELMVENQNKNGLNAQRIKPEEPQSYECCGNGCDNCVWNVYYDDLKEYEAEQKRMGSQEEKKFES